MKRTVLVLFCLLLPAFLLFTQNPAGVIEVEDLEAGLSSVITFGGMYQSQGNEFA